MCAAALLPLVTPYVRAATPVAPSAGTASTVTTSLSIRSSSPMAISSVDSSAKIMLVAESEIAVDNDPSDGRISSSTKYPNMSAVARVWGTLMTGSSDEAPILSTVNAVGALASLVHPTSLPVPPMSPLSSRLPLPDADVSRELPEVGTAPNVMDAIL